ncbi:MAG: tagaturonate epimerase family protein [Bacteroidota bacterium]
MNGWKSFCSKVKIDQIKLEQLKELAKASFQEYQVYPDSLQTTAGSLFFIARENGKKFLVILSNGTFPGKFDGSEVNLDNSKAKVCDLTNKNCDALRELFPFTKPKNHRGIPITVGLGDRLGLASPGHIRLIKDLPVFPILAQQSIRELNLTGRTYPDVLAAASWAVFQEGYTKGFGADGDHLKTADEVKMALDCGYTMITLDCSEHIDNPVAALSANEIADRYQKLPQDIRAKLEAKYLGKTFDLKGVSLTFNQADFQKIVLVYLKAINYTIDLYNTLIKNYNRKIDFEMSIDETLTSTSPESHYFVAAELIDAGLEVTSLAPRFCGEFQKGIDYIGELPQFNKEFTAHFKIAEHFGYKISVHSGSDKFAVFPTIGKETGGKYHLKTAGTNWLEAVRVIAAKNPALYRRMHQFALINLAEARKYYHISADPAKVPDINKMSDSELPGLMDLVDPRQVLHITYGLILQAKNPDGTSTFRDEIYETLDQFEAEYYTALERHIGKHLKLLGVMK